jgi:competence protein ComEC
VGAWLLPASACAFWLGLLAAPSFGRVAPVLAWLVLGGGALVASLLVGAELADVTLQRGLVDRRLEAPAVSAASPGRPGGRAPPALALALAGLVALGIGWGTFQRHRVEGSLLRSLAPGVVAVEGQLRTDPSISDHGWSAILDVRRVASGPDAWAVREPVWVSGTDAPPAVRGDRLRVEGTAEVPEELSFRSSLERRGIGVEVRGRTVGVLGHASDPLLRAAQAFRGFVGRSISRLFPQREAGLLLGLALGDDSRLDEALARDFHATGLGHLLVVSGENVAMVLAPILGLALWLRLSRWPTFLLAGGTVLFFVVLTGAEPSVMRAGVMAGLTLLGVLAGRPRSTASILAGAVLFLLVLDPTLVWAIGFQLSVVATAGMVAMATSIADRIRFAPRPMAMAAGATIAAQLAVTPILLLHFHEVPLVTVAANVLAFPAVSPALLLGLLAGGVGVLWPVLARPIAALALVPMRYLEALADRLGRAPVPWITSGGGIGVLLVGGAVVLGLAWWLRGRRRIPRPALVLAVALMPLFVWSTALSSGPPSGLVVRFFDVGQGDAALVSSPAGANVLIDGGPDPSLVATKLAALGVKRLDAVVATHPHEDHYVGLPEVLSRFPVGLVLDSGCPVPEARTQGYRAFLGAVRAKGIPERHPTRGDVIQVGDLRFQVLSPDRCWQGTHSDPNNDSLVLLLEHLDDTVLFANEPEAEAQEVMVQDGVPIAADVLNVPHHGAGTSIGEFFALVHERVAIVSVGPNDYGHPVPETLEALRATGARVFRTDRTGDLVIAFQPDGILVQTGRGRTILFEGGPVASAP